jgi:hypothetical protein
VRLFSSLLLAAFGGVLSAAPAAKLSLPAPEPKTTEAPGTQQSDESEQREQPTRVVVSARVVLLKAEHIEDGSSAGPAPADLTADTPLHLRTRKLARVRPPHPPTRTTSGADVRAGLLSIPPPLA